MDSTAWAIEEFGDAELGDFRRTRRLVAVAAVVAERPAGRVTAVFTDAAEREGAYRLLSNAAVEPDVAAETMFDACALRCVGLPYVFSVEDGSSVAVGDPDRVKGTGPVGAKDKGGRGFEVMTSLVLSPKGVPLGIAGLEWWARSDEPQTPLQRRKPEERESRFWTKLLASVETRFHDAGGPKPWVQMDRGADGNAVFAAAQTSECWVTVRSAYDRRLASRKGEARQYLRATMAATAVAGIYRLPVSASPTRTKREARMVVHFCKVRLHMQNKQTKTVRMADFTAVWTHEEGTTPEGEASLDWLLLTTFPVEDLADACQVIFGYSLRWRIEDYHRAWKSGISNVEDNQLRSEHAIRLWSILLASAAVRLMRMTYLARHEPDIVATVEFTIPEIHAVYLARSTRWDGKVVPTIGVVVDWIARLGGYTGKSSGGPPGYIVLARGWARVAPIVTAVETLMAPNTAQVTM